MHLFYADACDCAPTKPLVDGTLPEYYDLELAALRVYVHHEVQGHRYFAVHFGKKHALGLREVGK